MRQREIFRHIGVRPRPIAVGPLVERVPLANRLHLEEVHQQLVAKAALDGDLMALTKRLPSMLDAMQAGGAALFHRERWWCAGLTPSVDRACRYVGFRGTGVEVTTKR